MTRRRIALIAALGLLAGGLGLWGCGKSGRVTGTATALPDDATPGAGALMAPGRHYGPEKKVGDGKVRSFVVVNDARRPVRIGVELRKNWHKHLPAGMTEYVLPLPKAAGVPPYTHIGLDFNPDGHEPPRIYDVPHFDVHFYMIGEAERAAIDGSGGGESPPAQFVPRPYVSTVDVVPRMGVHWVDPTSPEFQPGGTFTRTLIYGFYQGVMAFIEPMVTVAFLASGPGVVVPIPQPQIFHRNGYYPQTYRIGPGTYRDRVEISLDELSWRMGVGRGVVADKQP